MGEFDLIRRYFTPAHTAADVLLGVGDDAAVLAVPNTMRLVAAVDTIVSGVHFPVATQPFDIGYRALAVNLSDLAAMGAIPRWCTLSLCIPQAEETWLAEFARGVFAAATPHGVQLVGGDTVKGSLNISVQLLGVVEADRWLTRHGAQPGDLVCVSGTLGDAAAGLTLALQQQQVDATSQAYLLERFYRPTARVELGRALRTLATAAMDISDGLLTDLRKLCAASNCGAEIHVEQLPLSSALRDGFAVSHVEQWALGGGDDYELLFTVSPDYWSAVQAVSASTNTMCTCIGRVVTRAGVSCCKAGRSLVIDHAGFDHFATENT